MKEIKDGRVKITPEVKQEIIEFCQQHPENKKEMAEKYNVSDRRIRQLCNINNVKVEA